MDIHKRRKSKVRLFLRRNYKYDWNLFGKQYGINITKRLEWINGKPMVFVAHLNLALLAINLWIEKNGSSVPELEVVTSFWGWSTFNVLAKVAFWILFIDGIIVNYLWGYTRGNYYCSIFVRLIKYRGTNIMASVKEELSWAHFLFTHVAFDNNLQDFIAMLNAKVVWVEEKRNEGLIRCSNYFTYNGKYGEEGQRAYSQDYQRGFNSLVDKYCVRKDEKGRYISLKDKKYQRQIKKL